MTLKWKGYSCLGFISIAWGSTWAVNKYVIDLGVPPLEIAWARQIFAGSLIIGFFTLFKKTPLPNLKQFKWLLVMSFLAFFMSNALANVGLKYIPSSLAALIGALYPIILILLEAFLFKNIRLNKLAMAGILLGFGGIAFISILDNFYLEHNRFIIDWKFWFGIILSFIALFSWSLSSIKLTRDDINLNPTYSIAWQLFIGSLIIWIFMILLPGKQFKPFPKASILPMFYLALFGSILSFIAFQYSLKTLGMSITSLYAYINPIVTTFMAWVWLGEIITKFTILGSIITLLGVYLVNKSLSLQKGHTKILTEVDAI